MRLKLNLRKVLSIIATSAILFNSVAPYSIAIAQELTPEPSPTSTDTESSNPEATVEPTESPTETPTPSEIATPTPEATVEPSPAVDLTTLTPDTTQSETQNTTNESAQTLAPPTDSPAVDPSATPATPVEYGDVTTTVVENIDLSTIVQLNSNVDTATVTTDKPDYSPTSVVLITGSGFTADKTYSIEISSTDQPPVTNTDNVTADAQGNFSYAYQLDGNYRPNYKVEVKDANFVVARTTFTDSATGTNNAGTGADGGGSGSSWTNLGFITSDDTNYSTSTISTSGNSHYLFGTNYGFSIPSGSVINGISVTIARSSSSNSGSNSISDDVVQLLKTGTRVGSDYGTSTDWPTSIGTATYGGVSDKWGTTWSAEDINSSGFGVAISGHNQSGSSTRTASVDYIQVTISYSFKDLTVTKTNNVSGSVMTNTSFNWVLTVTNNGTDVVSFTNNNIVLTDQLPSGPTYGTPLISLGGGTSGSSTACSISAGKLLTCDSNNPNNLNIPSGGSLVITIPVSSNSAGTFTNPTGGTCSVDPNNSINNESDETNNTCAANTVIVSAPTASPTPTATPTTSPTPTVAPTATPAPNLNWPTDWTTPNSCVTDPSGEPGVSPTEVDLVGNTGTPAVGFSSDANYFYFRERVNGDPGLITNLHQYSWVVLFQTTAPQYQYLGALSGKEANQVVLYDNTIHSPDSGGVDFLPLFNDPADNVVWQGAASSYGRVTGSGPYYLDWAIPITELTSRGINVSTTKFFATSTNANNYNKDSLQCYESFADLSVTKADSVDPVTSGGAETYTLSVHNAGPDTASGVVVTDTLPAGFAVTSVTPSQGNCSDTSAPSIQCELGTMTNGANATVTIAGTLTGSGTVTDTANVDLDTTVSTDLNLANNSDSEDTTINPATGTLTVNKVLVPSNDPGKFNLKIDSVTAGTGENVSNGGTTGSVTVNSGGHTVSETQGTGTSLSNYTSVIGGDCAANGSVTVNAGQNKVCTITNTRNTGTITIDKVTNPTGDTTLFDFKRTGDDNQTVNFSLSDGSTPTSYVLPTGIYSLEEINITSNWGLTGLSCDQGASINLANHKTTFDLDNNENITCTFTNIKLGSISGFKYEAGSQTPLTGWVISLYQGTSLVASQSSTLSGYSFNNLLPGIYSLLETLLGGWTQVTSPSDVNLAAGQDSTGNNFVNFENFSISGEKFNDLNGNGNLDTGEPGLPGWTIQLYKSNGSSFTIFDSAITNSDGNYTFGDNGPGEYRLFEVNQPGWAQTMPGSYYDVPVASGQDVTRMDFGNQMRGSITIVKDANPNDSQDFTFNSPGQLGTFNLDDDSDPTLLNQKVFSDLGSNNYTITEQGVAGWDLTNINCSGDDNPDIDVGDRSIILHLDRPGENISCTFTNTRNQGTIELRKIWSGTGGQTTLRIGTSVEGSEVDSQLTGSSGTAPLTTGSNTVDTGTYYTTEIGGLTDYTYTGESCFNDINNNGDNDNDPNVPTGSHASVVVEKDQHVVCTLTNVRNTGTILIHKLVDTDGDGSFETTDAGANGLGFFWGLDGVTPDRGMGDPATGVNTGSHNINETSVPDYHFVGWYPTGSTQISCASIPEATIYKSLPAAISVNNGQTTDITICNARDTGTITVQKVINPTDGGGKFNLLIGGTTYKTDAGDGDSTGTITLPTGKYLISETAGTGTNLSEYTAAFTGDCVDIDSGYEVTLSAGGNKTCTITNTKYAKIVVTKQTVPSGSTQSFHFVANYNTDPGFYLTDGQSNNTGYTRNHGPWHIAEDALAGWNTSASCDNGNPVDQIYTNPGQTVTCTFTNTRLGSISGVKYNDLNGNGVRDYHWENDIPVYDESTLSGWEIYIDSNKDGDWDSGEPKTTTDVNGAYSFTNLLSGEYRVREIGQSGWIQTSVNPPDQPITNGNDWGNINFGNAQLSNIHGVKWNDENGNGKRDCSLGIEFPCVPTESLLSGWTVFIDGNGNGTLDQGEVSTQTSDSVEHFGWYSFTNLIPGTYRICEVQQGGWNQTSSPACHTIQLPDGPNSCIPSNQVNAVTADSTCDFGNQQSIPEVSIEKTPETQSASAGQTVTFSLKVTNNGNTTVNNVSLTDILPGGFTYVTDSTEGDFTGNPNISGGTLTWNTGLTLVPEASLTINYKTTISSDLTDGIYTNFADCNANYGERLSVSCDPSDSATVTVGHGLSYGGNLVGQVLGASTELPATGSPSGLIALAILSLIVGITLRRNATTLKLRGARKHAKN